jgi:hypothetical protein
LTLEKKKISYEIDESVVQDDDSNAAKNISSFF